ncbi:alpha/beta hydrolase [Shewanella algidipiscicola]|uniref:Carboxylesterase n=1 Tax=Shewanella algidipiscicola TaxID=614070 RepID=A0ABQ4PLQ7_9GAMM|nr:alpha/beta hydrolase-fold protein [Shewanella algidipiscicola]GIU48884.1 carboxylesterase [Shewanella algidipiscicola]
MSNQPLEQITIEPKFPAKACVIWLHGLGDSGAGFAPVVPMLGMPDALAVRFIFPHAPSMAVTINQGYVMPAWYDIKGMEMDNRADMPGVLHSEKAIAALIDRQVAAGIPAENIVLAGFSQGGVMSLFTGLRYPKKLAGIMALSCYLPTGNALPTQLSEANLTTPILQQHGEQDEVVPLSLGLAAFELIRAAGYPTQWQTYPMGHSVLPNQLQDIGRWLTDCLS